MTKVFVNRKARAMEKSRKPFNTKHYEYTDPESEQDWQIEFSIESYGHPGNGWDDAGEAAEIVIWGVTLEDFPDINFTSCLTLEDEGRITNIICEKVYNGDWEIDDYD